MIGADRIVRHPVVDIPPYESPVAFSLDGRTLTGRPNEMISSALFAHGIHVFGHHAKDGAPQGLFCANGQCGQCLVMADGRPVKACLTPLRPGMRVRTLNGPPELEPDDAPVSAVPRYEETETDVLIVGGGPAGLAAAAELLPYGLRVILCDDKPRLGGKLGLQTHNFFGSAKEAYAGHRGTEIGRILEEAARSPPGLEVWTEAPAVGVFEGGRVGVLRDGAFTVVRPRALLVAAGAREKMLAFPGADLPGVYGAGAFQTLVNRDWVRPARRLLIVGGGNVGLIVAYQALQAGVDVVALVEALPEVGGYRVHRDKIVRLGVPVYTSHTVLRAEGREHVERAIVARVDERFRPIPGTEAAFDVDTILIAVGLAPLHELYDEAERLGMRAYAAGDAHEIAEASAAIFSGKITARTLLHDLGYPVEIPEDWLRTRELLASRPGPVLGTYPLPSGLRVYPVIRCAQEIPCDPCTTVCPEESIVIPEGNLLGRPKLVGDCVGCLKCVVVCPGLAITLVDRRADPGGERAKVTIPWEMPDGAARPGQLLPTTGPDGEEVGVGKVVRIVSSRALRQRRLMVLDVPASEADRVAGVRIREPEPPAPAGAGSGGDPGQAILCRCERVTRAEVLEYVRATGARDLSALKAGLRTGMGPCGGKTCEDLILGICRDLGIEERRVNRPVHRPFTQEIPLAAFVHQGGNDGDGG
jgi:sarcosine oxidase, subunit alpha